MSFQDVIINSERQYDRCIRLTDELRIIGKIPDIEAFYPELHGEELSGKFTNTVGSHLLPDLLTSSCVVVDLYDWKQESDLIKKYGVDLSFLLRLREAGLVRIAANLPPERYRNSPWLHEILSKDDTIFRSVRTPLYYRSVSRDAIDRQKELKKDLQTRFDAFTDAEIRSLSVAANAATPPDTAEALAEAISWWTVRFIAAAAGMPKSEAVSESENLIRTVVDDPAGIIHDLRRNHFLAVSPTSAGLGSVCKFPLNRVRAFFDDSATTSVLMREFDFVWVEEIRNLLARYLLETMPNDLSSDAYWRSLSEYDKDRFFDIAQDRDAKIRALNVERALRLEAARLDKEGNLDELRSHIEKIANGRNRILENVENGAILAENALILLGLACGSVGNWAALVGAIGGIAGCKIFRNIGREALEVASSKIEITNFLRRRN